MFLAGKNLILNLEFPTALILAGLPAPCFSPLFFSHLRAWTLVSPLGVIPRRTIISHRVQRYAPSYLQCLIAYSCPLSLCLIPLYYLLTASVSTQARTALIALIHLTSVCTDILITIKNTSQVSAYTGQSLQYSSCTLSIREKCVVGNNIL